MIHEKERFEALFEYASLGILVANDKGIIEMANSLLAIQFGYENKNDIIGNPVEILIPRRYESTHHHHRAQFNEKPARRTMGVGRDLFAVKKDGSEFPVEVSLSHYTLDGKLFVIAFVIDITKRKEIENAVNLQKEQLLETNLKIENLNDELEEKVELRTVQLKEALQEIETSRDELKKALNKEKELSDLKSRFVSMASHEFRTPLSTILSSASLLAKYIEADEQEKRNKHITRIKSSVNNLTGILDEFLSIGKIEDGKIEAHYDMFNIKDMINTVCTDIQPLAKVSQKIVYSHEGPDMANLDAALLRNILINLLSNAIKFTSEGGLIQVSSSVDNDQVKLSIQDNGMGISEQDQQHLFERFFRATNATNIPGTGLGLHIVAKYAELMNGIVTYTSELEHGTCFTITFNKEP